MGFLYLDHHCLWWHDHVFHSSWTERQIEEKKANELKQIEDMKVKETWADKLGQSHRPVPLPEQPTVVTAGESYGVVETTYQPDTHRANSAPEDSKTDEPM